MWVGEENGIASKMARNRYVETLPLHVAEEYEPIRQGGVSDSVIPRDGA